MSLEKRIEILGQKLLNGEITPEQHVEEYNRLIALEKPLDEVTEWGKREFV